MNVLILSQHYWPETFRINEVAESLIRAGCRVRVLTGQPNYPEGRIFKGYRGWGLGRELHASGYTIHRVPLLPRGRGGALRMVGNYLSFLASACVLGPWSLRGERVDVIFVYGTSPVIQAIAGVVLKTVKRARLVMWVQDLWPQALETTGFVRSPRLLKSVATVVRWIYRRCDLLLAQSHAFADSVRAMAGPTPVEYHPNPGELAFSLQAADRPPPALTLPPGFNIVFAGNFGTVQALDTLVDAAERLRAHPGINLVLIGSGSRGPWLAQAVKEKGLTNVVLPGRFPPEAMPGILAQASALLVSLTRGDGLSQTVPSKVQAYLAAGRPVIASLDGEGASVVREAGAGITCPAEDAQALADAILALRDTAPEERERMCENGRLHYEQHFEPELLARRLTQRFSELMSGPGPKPTDV